MAESMSEPITNCPWCSVLLAAPGAKTCPACGAALTAVPNAPAEIRGVTTLDTEAILRARSSVSQPRGSRLLSFITGEIPVDTSTPAAAEVFAPPPEDVRREMRRLQMDAQRADLVAETVALKSDELTRRGIHISELEGDEAVAVPEAAPPSPEAEPGGAPAAAVDAEAAPEGGWPAELTPDAVEPAPEHEPETEPESRD
jgi:hypothetical protein